MLKENLNKLIMESMKNGDKLKTSALRAVKTAIMQWETAKENVGKEYTEAVEVNILRKLKNQYLDAAELCNDGKHEELVKENTDISNIINEFLPAPVTEEMIEAEVINLTTGDATIEPLKKNMGAIIKLVKTKYPSADGKLVSQVVMKNLN